MNYELDSNKEHIFGIKSAILYEVHNGVANPKLYIKKPKSVSEEEYRELLRQIKILLPKEYLVKREKIREEYNK